MADTQTENNQPGAEAPFTEQVKDQVKQQTQQAVQQGQEYAGRAVDLARTQIVSQLAQQKNSLGVGVTELAEIVRQSADELRGKGLGAFASPYLEGAAQKLNEFGTTAQQKEIDEVLRDTENFARAQPVVFLGAATLIGFAAARFLKSSATQAASAQ